METPDRDSTLKYVSGVTHTGRRGAGWTTRDGEPLETIDNLAAHLAAAEAAAVANGY